MRAPVRPTARRRDGRHARGAARPRAAKAAARLARRLGPCWLALAVVTCADLRPLARDVCGNGVLEAGEDCDRFVAFEGASCRPGPGPGACRYECAPPGAEPGGGGPTCPAGYGCGVDGTCRQHSGGFSAAAERAQEAAASVRVADFDGDGRDDVLALGAPSERGERSARVLYRDEGGFAAPRRLPDVFRSVAIGGFGAGAARGLALVSDQSSLVGVDLLVGNRDRGFASLVNPALGGVTGGASLPPASRLVILDALPRRFEPGAGGVATEVNQGDEVALLAPGSFGAGGTTIYGLVASEKDLPANAPPLPLPIVSLLTIEAGDDGSSGGLGVGRFSLPDAAAPTCEDVVWAPRGSAEVYVLSPCRVEGGEGERRVVWNQADVAGRVEPLRVALPDGARAATGAARWLFVADANGDGVSDVALMTDRGAYVAFGRADGALPEIVPAGVGPERSLLAFGDLNGDRAPDWVLDDGVVVSAPGAPAGVSRVRSPAPWSEALVGDVNGDARPDVVAVGATSRTLEVYLGGEGGLFNEVGVPVAGQASQLAAGDFDGDSVLDLAFAVRGEAPGAGPVTDSVFVAFGGASSVAAPVRVGEMRGVRQIVAGSYAFGGADLDGADDLGVLGAVDGAGAAQAAVLFGNAERQPRSPLLVSTETLLSPWAVATGRFAAGEGGGPGPVGVALLAGDPAEGGRPYSFWLSSPSPTSVMAFSPPSGDARPEARPNTALPPPVGAAPPHDAALRYDEGEEPQAFAGDLDGDGLDEALALVPAPEGGARLVVARAHGAGAGAMLFVEAVVEGLPRSTQAGLADADGDGRPDLVALAPRAGAAGGGNLSVYWNAGGAFDAAGAVTRVALPGGPAAAWAAAPGAAGARLYAVDAAGVYAVDFGPDRAASVRALEGLEGGEALAAGDVTGDGVVDLVVGGGGALRVARGEPVLP
jgi:hypothetical protein